MSDKKEKPKHAVQNRCDECHKNLLPICCLVSMLTAVFVTLIFSTAFTGLLVVKNDNLSYRGAFAESTKEGSTNLDDYGFTKLDTSAVVDMMFLAKGKGLVLVTGDNSSENEGLASKIQAQALGATIYHYDIVHDGNSTDQLMQELLVGGDSDGAPALLYISGGSIYDRLDDTHSEAVVSTFIAKYR